MASPFVLNLLPASVRAGLPFIEAGVSRGLSINAITRNVRAGGIRTSPDSIGTAVRLLRRQQEQERRAIRRSVGRPIQVDRLPQAITDIKRNVSYKVNIQFIHPESGRRLNKQITVSTDQTDLSPSQIAEKAVDIFSSVEQYEGGDVIGADVIGGKKSPLFNK